MTIIVTGGAGFIGSHFLEYIKDRTDSKIIVLDKLTYAANKNNIPNSPNIEFLWCDIANEDHINYIFNKYKPKNIYHFAAESHVDNSIKNYRPFLESNVIGTINLLNAFYRVILKNFIIYQRMKFMVLWITMILNCLKKQHKLILEIPILQAKQLPSIM